MRIEPRDIEYFAVTAEHGHLGRAAETLGLSQFALSKCLRRLERSVQAKVVKRTPKGVELTSVGAALLAQARRLRLTLEDISREAADVSLGLAGFLRVGATARLAVDLIPEACGQLLAVAPRASLKVAVVETRRGAPAVASGDLDLYLTANLLSGHDEVTQQHLFEEDWSVFASSRHRLAGRKRVTLADVASERWILGIYEPAQIGLPRRSPAAACRRRELP